MAADWEGIHPRELRQMEEIRELDMEELNVETDDEGDEDEDEDEDEEDGDGEGEEEGVDYSHLLAIRSFTRLDGGNGRTVNREASLHAYLGEVDDTPGRKVALLDAGAILSLPMLFLHGVILFPEATLPLRLIEARLVAAVEKALRHVDAPNTIGVVLMYRRPNHRYYASASVGTTAEIRQLGRLDDGSVNVKARGQQRFRLIRHWQDVDGVVWGEVQIIEEDAPLRTPRDAFAQLAASSSVRPHTCSPVTSLDVSSSEQHDLMDSDIDCDTPSQKSTASDQTGAKMCHSGSQSSNSMKLSISGQSGKNADIDKEDYVCLTSPSSARTTATQQHHQYNAASYSKQPCQASLSFWPRWAYEMYDSYALARRAADLWKLIIKNRTMDDYVTKPDLLSFYIGSQLPVAEPLRQKLLEIDGISYRLRREIQLLNACDIIKCRNCKSEIAKRSDVVALSSDGPLGTYVNPHGYVHATITVNNATGLALEGTPSKVHSWFPGYAWTIASCARCGSNIGWLFSTTKKHLLPKSFWGIRSSQIADIVEEEQQEE